MVLDFAKEAIEHTSTHSINFDELRAGKANIKVIGVGGMGCNAITWLFNKGINGASIYGANTDALHLSVTKADEKVLIGKELTRGLGCGGKPQRGREAAKEAIVDLKKAVGGADMVFIIAGQGGGTGTGAAPIIAQLAKETGAVVIGVVTMPFESEKARIDKAEFGLQELREVTDTCIVLDNNRLVDIAGQLPIEQAFAVANELVSTMVKGIVETITLPSLINLDYAPLLDVDYKGASGALIHITCGPDLKLEEFDVIGRTVSENLNPEAQVIIGARISKEFTGKVRVITIMTGVSSPYVLGKSVEEHPLPASKELSDLGIEVWR